MGNLISVVAIVIVILVIYMYLSPKMENLVNEMNWNTMARGLNASNSGGYSPVISTLSAMEKTNAAGIQV